MGRTEKVKELKELLENKTTTIILDAPDFERYKKLRILPKKYYKYQNYIVNFKYFPNLDYTQVYRIWIHGINYFSLEVPWHICREEELIFLKRIVVDYIFKNKKGVKKMENKAWMALIEENYDEIYDKLVTAVELAKEKCWGTVDVIMNQDGLLYIDEEASINTMAGEILKGDAIYIKRFNAEDIDEDTEIDVDEVIEIKLDELNF